MNRSGWNDASFRGYSQSPHNVRDRIPDYGWGFHYNGGRYFPHQTLGPTAPNVVPLQQPKPVVPHQTSGPSILGAAPFEHAKPVFPHQTSGPTIPTVVPLHKQTPAVPHQTSGPTIPSLSPLQLPTPAIPHQISIPAVAPFQHPKPVFPHPTSGPTIRTKLQSHQPTPAVPHQTSGSSITSLSPLRLPMPEIPHQTLGPTIPTVAPLRQPTPAVPPQTSEPTIPTVAPFRQPTPAVPPQTSEATIPTVAPLRQPTPAVPPQTSEPTIPTVAPLRQPTPAAPLQTSEPTILTPAPSRQPKPVVPHQTSKSTVPTQDKLQWSKQALFCEICDVRLSSHKVVEQHQNGKRHQEMLRYEKNRSSVKNMRSKADFAKPKNFMQKDIAVPSKVRAQGTRWKPKDDPSVRGCGIKRKIGGADIGETMLKSKKTRCSVKNVSPEATVSKPKYYMQKDTAVPSKARVQGSHGKSKDNSSVQVRDIKHKISGATTGKTVPKSEKKRFSEKYVSPEATVSKPKNDMQKDIVVVPSEVLAQGPQGEPKDNTGVQSCGIKCKTGGSTNGKMVLKSNKNRCSVKNVSPEATVAKPKNYVHKDIAVPSEVPAQGSQGKPKDNTGVQGCGIKRKIEGARISKYMKTNNELRRPTESSEPDVNTLPNSVESLLQVAPAPMEGLSSELEVEHGSASQTLVSKGKEHLGIQNAYVETDDQPQSISLKLHAFAGSNVNTKTEDMSSDSAIILVTPSKGHLASDVFATPPALGSSFESQIQPVLHTETEPQVSQIVACCERRNPTNETNVQLLSSALVEFGAPSCYSTDTQTVDGSSKAEERMDIPTTELGITQLSQVSVCLQCGDGGFSETLVYCNECQMYALHRYCLDGPVIFIEDVTWFCEDCEVKVVDTSAHDHCILLPSGESDNVNSAKDASQARVEPTNCMKRVEENKKLRQIAANTKVSLLSDTHSLPHHQPSQCSNICAEEKMVDRDCQPVAKDRSDTSEGSSVVTCPQPIADPIWRGSLCLSNKSCDTFGGLLAHLCNLACPKAQKETRLFPEVLCADLLQRSAVWPKSFLKCGANENSIALYFFPENERVERAFDKLVDDMISLDLAVRAVTENAELLVFPSTVLPDKCRRFQAKYYLWGLFKAKITSIQDKSCGV